MAKFTKVYENEWKIGVLAHPTVFKNIVTPSFAPFPDNNITFCFKAWYQQMKSTYVDLFKLKLVKLSSAPICPTFKTNVFVNICYFDGSLLAERQKLHFVDEIVTFDDVVESLRFASGISTTHYDKMKSKTLIIKCKMIYNDQDYTSNNRSADKMKSSNKYGDLISNLKSMYEPSVLSDFIFKVGDKSFPAHKFILVAHSPVFKNMMTHEFQESKTNSVTITDATPETFELFLRYLYSGELENKSWDTLRELYYLTDKYDVGFFKTECSDTAISILSVDLVCEILKLAYSYSDSDLKNAAIDFAVNHIKEIVPREDWKELVKTDPIIGYEVTVNFIPK